MSEMVRIVDKNPPKNPEEKIYLICIEGKEGADNDWFLVKGRTEAYDLIKESIDIIDLEKSFILVESSTLDKRKSIYAFMKYVEQFFEDAFDIDDYIKGDWSEEDYKIDNDMSSLFNIDNEERLDMTSIMNGDVKSVSLYNDEDN